MEPDPLRRRERSRAARILLAACATMGAAACSTQLSREEVEAMQGFPGSPGAAARFDRAEADLTRGDAETALKVVQELRDRFPNNIRVHRLYQDAKIKLGQMEEVVAEYERLARTQPSALHDTLISRVQSDSELGTTFAVSAIRKDDRYPWAWYARGWWDAKREDRRQDAEAAFKRALDLQPDLVPALRAYAKQMRGSDVAAAIEAIERAIELHPEDRSQRVLLASLRYEIGGSQIAKAEAEYRQLLEEVPDDVESARGLAACLIERGDWRAAKAIYERLRKANPDDPTPEQNLGIVAEVYEKDPAAALAHYQRFLKLAYRADAPYLEQFRVRFWVEQLAMELARTGTASDSAPASAPASSPESSSAPAPRR